MRSLTKKAVGFVSFLLCSHLASAQLYTHRYEAGITAGSFVYQGDLTPSDLGAYETMRPNFGFFASRILNRSLSVRLNFTFGKLTADDGLYESPEYRKQRNFRFSTPVTEVSGVLEWNILAKNARENSKGLSPYLFAGAGVSFLQISRDASRFNPEFFNSENVAAGLATDLARRPPGAVFVLPAGVGVKYALTPRLALAAESGYRFMFTDYLDGFSYGANPAKKDSYYRHSLGLIFSLGNKSRYDCPPL